MHVCRVFTGADRRSSDRALKVAASTERRLYVIIESRGSSGQPPQLKSTRCRDRIRLVSFSWVIAAAESIVERHNQEKQLATVA